METDWGTFSIKNLFWFAQLYLNIPAAYSFVFKLIFSNLLKFEKEQNPTFRIIINFLVQDMFWKNKNKNHIEKNSRVVWNYLFASIKLYRIVWTKSHIKSVGKKKKFIRYWLFLMGWNFLKKSCGIRPKQIISYHNMLKISLN